MALSRITSSGGSTVMMLYGAVMNNLGQVDAGTLQAEGELPLLLPCYGPRPLRAQLEDLLYHDPYLNDYWSGGTGSQFGPGDHDPLVAGLLPIEALGDDPTLLPMALLLVDGTRPFTDIEERVISEVQSHNLPLLIVVFNSTSLPRTAATHALPTNSKVITLHNLAPATARDMLGHALLALLPPTYWIAAARYLPALRPLVADHLVRTTALTNAIYTLLSNTFRFLPVFKTVAPIADALVINKNHMFMLYKLALLHGTDPDFRARLPEMLATIGAGYAWSAVGDRIEQLIPLLHVVPKAATAYATTYIAGVGAWRQYAFGEVTNPEVVKQLFAKPEDTAPTQPDTPPASPLAPDAPPAT